MTCRTKVLHRFPVIYVKLRPCEGMLMGQISYETANCALLKSGLFKLLKTLLSIVTDVWFEFDSGVQHFVACGTQLSALWRFHNGALMLHR